VVAKPDINAQQGNRPRLEFLLKVLNANNWFGRSTVADFLLNPLTVLVAFRPGPETRAEISRSTNNEGCEHGTKKA
jgi:hypothetical protein